jgi:glycosyltransferase involved in cell wall biosynthesis
MLISIIIPTKNRLYILKDTIKSLKDQTYINWEAIIIDDGSSDGTDIFFKDIQDKRIKYFKRKSRKSGAPVCRNEGIKRSKGKYVIFLDSDDYLLPNCLKKRLEFMSLNPDLDFGVFLCRLYDNKLEDLDLLWNVFTKEDDINRFLKLDIPWQTTGPIWKRSSLKKVGRWDETLRCFQGWEYNLRALIKGLKYKKFEIIDYFWRETKKDSISYKGGNPGHFPTYKRLISKTLNLLKEKNKLTTQRKNLVAGLYFWLVNCGVMYKYKRGSLKAWNICKQKKLIGSLKYIEGLLYILLGGGKIVKKIGRVYVKFTNPKVQARHFQGTFKRCTIDHLSGRS